MGAILDHTIVPVRDQEEAVQFYNRLLGFRPLGRTGMNDRFAVVEVYDGFNLDFEYSNKIPDPGFHYAYAMDRQLFDQSFQAIKDSGISYGDGPTTKGNMKGPGISTGAKGATWSVYFNDPSGHRLEIITYSD